MTACAIVVLGQNSVTLAKQIKTALLNATIYGLAERTSNVDVSFTNFGETLRELFAKGTPIIGICAAGILIRTLAPIISDKRQEPPVLAVAEDGSAVVPLLGGLQGVNDLARQIAAVLEVKAAITTTGDIRFHTALLSPPAGYHLANPDDAKKFISDLLAGATVKLKGTAPWLVNSKLPFDEEGKLTIQVTEYEVPLTPDCLVYHPATLAIGVSNASQVNSKDAISCIQQMLADAKLSIFSVAGVFALDEEAASVIEEIADALNVPVRFLNCQSEKNAVAIALTATGANGKLVVQQQCGINLAVAVSGEVIDINRIGKPRGQLFIVGTGPGAANWMSPEVQQILSEATDLVGYSFYLDLAGSLREGQRRHEFDNREELARAEMALDLAAEGRIVAVVSSGDPGIYAMAAAVFEVLDCNQPKWQSIKIHVAPGISAIQAAAARIGAPIGHDFCVISLSDILKPWSIIERRIIAAAEADLAIAFYNPASKQRTSQLASAREILLRYRSPQTIVVLARNVGRTGESVLVRTLADLSPQEVDMRTLVLVGSSKTRTVPHYGGVWVYTPRQY
ncbi:cobalamin biosynthesis precorrin-3 methylase [Tolypothrix sp. NIES-4075]|uniref:precorrin-3B C(17)-methyltransferase n=1 Tax=Tolypothrix sp. NIES-4075 TaxID=2005459 RepID=UPI000B5CB89B|nr:precorrin-3B C(17)-methyltransferase [Tolypothrix sp. NIES-4075]GAX40498.1 cobalamin biosynthesis precorrin-3 methylase [Tolypothrix sp. NIES-4075]